MGRANVRQEGLMMLSRLKFETQDLVTDMLDSIDESAWTSDTTTFLDPTIGGGQFVTQIEQRLRDQGHSDDNIKGRVFGFEINKMRVNFAVNKNKLVGTYTDANFLDLNLDQKFDYIIGGPPFKNGNETGGKSSMWRKVAIHSWKHLAEQGTIIMLAPQLPNVSKDLGHMFTENQCNVVWTDVKKYFPGIGSSFFAWSVSKTPKTTKTFFKDENVHIDLTKSAIPKNIHSIPIIEKFFNKGELFECKSSPEYMHTSVADGKNEDHLSKDSKPSLPYSVRRTSGANYKMYGAVEPTDYLLPKVVMTFSGNPHYRFHDSNDPIGTIKYQSGHILVADQTEGENLIALYQTRLYKFIQDQMALGGMRGSNYYELPKMPLDKKWTDEELYEHFDLTQDEIEIISNG